MSFDLLFNLAGAYIVPFWVGMIVFPKHKITQKIMSTNLPFIPLGLLYVYFVIASFDLESALTLANPQLSDFTRIFAQEGAASASLAHILFTDLFLGKWIYWQGLEKKIFTPHSLVLCIFYGPTGLLSHLITEKVFGNKNDDSKNSDNKELEDK